MGYEAVRIKIPGSTANLGPGFDTLGMALSLYAWIEMKPADTTAFHLYGDELRGIPKDKSNLIYKVAQSVFKEAGVHIPELEISMYSEIPLTRGLGSSASAIVGALVAANEMIGAPLSLGKLLNMATKLEKHPDNVGASLLGGIVTAAWDGVETKYIHFNAPNNLEVLVAIPEFQLSTSAARGVLPSEVSLKDAVYNISRTSLLTTALAVGRLDLIPFAMQDCLHQPYRASLVPGLQQVLEDATSHGALGAALSGAGPTVLTLVDSQSPNKEKLEQFLQETFAKQGIKAKTLWLKPCALGANRLTIDEEDFFEAIVRGASL